MMTLRALRRIHLYVLCGAMIAAALAKFFARRKTTSAIPSLLEITLDDVIAGLEHGIFTSNDLVLAYINRIEEVDGVFKSVIEINPDALSIARSLDEEEVIRVTRVHMPHCCFYSTSFPKYQHKN